MKITFITLIVLCLLAWHSKATVYEANTSEDVDLFIADYQDETIALLFYDSDIDNADTQTAFARLINNVLGIFMSHDQEGRSTEDWINMLDDKLHLMRIDLRNKDLLRTKESFNIEKAPFIVLQDKQKTVLREEVNEDTFKHVKDILQGRPNIMHKTGGAVLMSFNLEPDTDNPTPEPKVIQYFDLENDMPTNVEPPKEKQYVNWGEVDVIGPDGAWEKRGRNWVSSFEIPDSGIKNQKKASKVNIQERTKDDPSPAIKPRPHKHTAEHKAAAAERPAGEKRQDTRVQHGKPSPEPVEKNLNKYWETDTENQWARPRYTGQGSGNEAARWRGGYAGNNGHSYGGYKKAGQGRR